MNKKKYKWSQRKEDQAINRAIIDAFIKMKKCPLLTNEKFICENFKGCKLRKGKEKFCKGPLFTDCPAFNQYLVYEIKTNRRKVK
jgi:hypothetical protein